MKKPTLGIDLGTYNSSAVVLMPKVMVVVVSTAQGCRRTALESLRQNSFSSEGALISQQNLEIAVQQVANNIENLEKKIRPIGFGV